MLTICSVHRAERRSSVFNTSLCTFLRKQIKRFVVVFSVRSFCYQLLQTDSSGLFFLSKGCREWRFTEGCVPLHNYSTLCSIICHPELKSSSDKRLVSQLLTSFVIISSFFSPACQLLCGDSVVFTQKEVCWFTLCGVWQIFMLWYDTFKDLSFLPLSRDHVLGNCPL